MRRDYSVGAKMVAGPRQDAVVGRENRDCGKFVKAELGEDGSEGRGHGLGRVVEVTVESKLR